MRLSYLLRACPPCVELRSGPENPATHIEGELSMDTRMIAILALVIAVVVVLILVL